MNRIFTLSDERILNEQSKRIQELEDTLKTLAQFPIELPNAAKLMKTLAKAVLKSESDSQTIAR